MSSQKVYLCLVKWPDGREGLLFPRPGNVAIADRLEDGEEDFRIACEHLRDYIEHRRDRKALGVTTIRLVEFERVKVVKEYGT